MKLAALKPFVAAIDPGKQTGIAIWSRKKDKVIYWCTGDFLSTQDYLLAQFPDKSEVQVLVEVPAGFVYKRNDLEAGFGRDAKLKMMAGVIREATLLANTLAKLGFNVVQVRPVPKKKWTDKQMRFYTGSKLSSNQHERDAARLALHYANKR